MRGRGLSFTAAMGALLAAAFSNSLPAEGLPPIFGAARRGAASAQRGPGWTQAQVQRMARKRRNVARHRASCKGKRQ